MHENRARLEEETAKSLDEFPLFDYYFEEIPDKGLCLIFSTDGENLDDPFPVLLLAQLFIRERRGGKGFITFTWSYGSDTDAVGAYGGGAAMVFADRIERIESFDWIQERYKTLSLDDADCLSV